MTRDELVARLRAAAPIHERVRVLLNARAGNRDTRAIDAELHQLKDRFHALVGPGTIPDPYLTTHGMTRIADVIEEGWADSVSAAIRVLRQDHEAYKERAHQFRLGLLRQQADHEARMYADEVDYFRTRSIVRAFRSR